MAEHLCPLNPDSQVQLSSRFTSKRSENPTVENERQMGIVPPMPTHLERALLDALKPLPLSPHKLGVLNAPLDAEPMVWSRRAPHSRSYAVILR